MNGTATIIRTTMTVTTTTIMTITTKNTTARTPDDHGAGVLTLRADETMEI
ncbi:hypothetical protein [Cupriavidus pauculus]|uniref:hypothetical protein n=1 Tax=Cupriavidus pauculus TaxID=82633 RepID=UPI0015DDE60F|nr:hypothetical protein [Cupriavidus pauculus]